MMASVTECGGIMPNILSYFLKLSTSPGRSPSSSPDQIIEKFQLGYFSAN